MLQLVPKAVWKVVNSLQASGHQAYPVGGAVRDILLGRKVVDWDVATSARPEQVIPLFSRVIPTGIQHGTVTVLQHSRPVEVTTFRGELGYTDGRHPDKVVFLDSLFDDLKRRDFTINAMALDFETSRLIDPLGGCRDLKNGLIRAVGNPLERFLEDGLRPMRAVRFACMLDFRIEPRTHKAIRASIAAFRKVAVERVREELLKILSSKHAASGVDLLLKSGLLPEVLPEIMPCIGFPQNRFHRYDVYHHTLKSLEKAKGDPILKLSVLLHDLGKPRAAQGPSGEYTFFGHEKMAADLADTIMKRLKFSNTDRGRVISLVANHMFHYQPEWTDGAIRRLVRKVGTNNLKDMWEMRRADVWGRGMGVKPALANLRSLIARVDCVMSRDTALQVTDLAIDGNQVMKILGIGPGPRVGNILNALLERVLDDPTLNNFNSLKSLLCHLGI